MLANVTLLGGVGLKVVSLASRALGRQRLSDGLAGEEIPIAARIFALGRRDGRNDNGPPVSARTVVGGRDGRDPRAVGKQFDHTSSLRSRNAKRACGASPKSSPTLLPRTRATLQTAAPRRAPR
jgi:hypothetical protein